MVEKFVILVSVILVVNAGLVPEYVQQHVINEPHNPNPQYSFLYEVQDPITGDSHGQYETRNGGHVKGAYALMDSDGTRRLVEYTADPINGFNAVVSKQPSGKKIIAPAAKVLTSVY